MESSASRGLDPPPSERPDACSGIGREGGMAWQGSTSRRLETPTNAPWRAHQAFASRNRVIPIAGNQGEQTQRQPCRTVRSGSQWDAVSLKRTLTGGLGTASDTQEVAMGSEPGFRTDEEAAAGLAAQCRPYRAMVARWFGPNPGTGNQPPWADPRSSGNG